ncbi:hypothetical protein ABSL23_17340 (plasmid) [Halobacterium sp. NMX12-1]|uniref:Uncharacterized protein n=1 Tax=Halobacterium sp. NMX12-1 TaxID=3166650 RepID=A0AAU8CIA3_9EURY
MSPEPSERWRRIYHASVVAWAVAVVILLPAFRIQATINPFLPLLSIMESVEAVAYVLGGGSIVDILLAYPGVEASYVLSGWFMLPAWLGGLIAYSRVRNEETSRARYLLIALPVPLLAFILGGLEYANDDTVETE